MWLSIYFLTYPVASNIIILTLKVYPQVPLSHQTDVDVCFGMTVRNLASCEIKWVI